MKAIAMLAVITATALRGNASQHSDPTDTVDVYLNSEVYLPNTTAVLAKAEASARFREVGITLRWHTGVPGAGTNGIVITVLRSAPASFNTPEHAAALATSLPYSGQAASISVFYERVLAVTQSYGFHAAIIFGHVLAHELGHVIEGIARHSREGLMRAAWTPGDRADMVRKGFRFSAEDVELLRYGLRRRTASLLAKNLTR